MAITRHTTRVSTSAQTSFASAVTWYPQTRHTSETTHSTYVNTTKSTGLYSQKSPDTTPPRPYSARRKDSSRRRNSCSPRGPSHLKGGHTRPPRCPTCPHWTSHQSSSTTHHELIMS